MLPSLVKWDGLGQPWQKSTPDGRLAKIQAEENLELPPPAQLPPPPKPADELQEVAPEVRAHIESLQKSMGSAFAPKLEQDIVAATSTSMEHRTPNHSDDALRAFGLTRSIWTHRCRAQ